MIAGKGKAIPVAVEVSASAGSQTPAAAAAGAPAKTKAKKVPRYVKEALREVEQEKAVQLASEQKPTSAQTDVQKLVPAGKSSKTSKKQVLKSKGSKAPKKGRPI